MLTTGKRIKFFRESLKLTQNTISQLLSMSQSNYSRIENDEIRVNLDIIDKLTLIFNIEKEALTNPEHPINLYNSSELQKQNDTVCSFTISDELKKLYEDKIKLLEEKIDYLESNK